MNNNQQRVVKDMISAIEAGTPQGEKVMDTEVFSFMIDILMFHRNMSALELGEVYEEVHNQTVEEFLGSEYEDFGAFANDMKEQNKEKSEELVNEDLDVLAKFYELARKNMQKIDKPSLKDVMSNIILIESKLEVQVEILWEIYNLLVMEFLIPEATNIQ